MRGRNARSVACVRTVACESSALSSHLTCIRRSLNELTTLVTVASRSYTATAFVLASSLKQHQIYGESTIYMSCLLHRREDIHRLQLEAELDQYSDSLKLGYGSAALMREVSSARYSGTPYG